MVCPGSEFGQNRIRNPADRVSKLMFIGKSIRQEHGSIKRWLIRTPCARMNVSLYNPFVNNLYVLNSILSQIFVLIPYFLSFLSNLGLKTEVLLQFLKIKTVC